MRDAVLVVRGIVMFLPAIVIGFLPVAIPYVLFSEALPQYQNDGTNYPAMAISIGLVGALYQLSNSFKTIVKFCMMIAIWLLTGEKEKL